MVERSRVPEANPTPHLNALIRPPPQAQPPPGRGESLGVVPVDGCCRRAAQGGSRLALTAPSPARCSYRLLGAVSATRTRVSQCATTSTCRPQSGGVGRKRPSPVLAFT